MPVQNLLQQGALQASAGLSAPSASSLLQLTNPVGSQSAGGYSQYESGGYGDQARSHDHRTDHRGMGQMPFGRQQQQQPSSHGFHTGLRPGESSAAMMAILVPAILIPVIIGKKGERLTTGTHSGTHYSLQVLATDTRYSPQAPVTRGGRSFLLRP
eukprot:9501186-Pyramimonas_sp.AAC.1